MVPAVRRLSASPHRRHSTKPIAVPTTAAPTARPATVKRSDPAAISTAIALKTTTARTAVPHRVDLRRAIAKPCLVGRRDGGAAQLQARCCKHGREKEKGDHKLVKHRHTDMDHHADSRDDEGADQHSPPSSRSCGGEELRTRGRADLVASPPRSGCARPTVSASPPARCSTGRTLRPQGPSTIGGPKGGG